MRERQAGKDANEIEHNEEAGTSKEPEWLQDSELEESGGGRDSSSEEGSYRIGASAQLLANDGRLAVA